MTGKTVLITGGAGYIGSHCCVEFLNSGYNVIAVDNFANVIETDGKATPLKRVEQITGKSVIFQKVDLMDKESTYSLFRNHKIDSVVHLAALKAVGPSMKDPLPYYKNNIIGTINLIEAMQSTGCYDLVFSSSCTVYGNPEFMPVTEEHPTGNVTNAYGRTKYFIEQMLSDLAQSNPKWRIISLRYFNPIGAHSSGLIGEDPTNIQHLMPFIGAVASGNLPHVTIHGNDYDTPDGTGVRDYIHVMDIASGHVAALVNLQSGGSVYKPYNLGMGKGTSVLELLLEFEKATGTKLPVQIADRRPGDVACVICSADLAKREFNWEPKRDLAEMCLDFWRWQTRNPNGYKQK